MTSRNTCGADTNTLDLKLPRQTGVSREAIPPDAPSATRLTLRGGQPGFADAMIQILRRYSGEVRSFLRARTNSRASMDEVFSAFAEDVWKGLPQYRAEGHLRAWIYVVARNALARHIRFKQRWRSRHVSVELDDLQLEVRRSVSTHLGKLAQLEPLLAALPEADRRLLEQRLVLARPWRDIAIERAYARGAATDSEIEKESARLRKRYQLLLQGLRARAVVSRDSKSD